MTARVTLTIMAREHWVLTAGTLHISDTSTLGWA